MYYTHPWNISLHLFLFYTTTSLLFFFSPNPVLTISASKVSYSDHCASFVPESVPQRLILAGNYTSNYHTGYFVTNKPVVLRPRPTFFGLNWWYLYETDVKGLLSVEAQTSLYISRAYFNGRNISVPDNNYSSSTYQFRSRRHYRRKNIDFFLQGFWSQPHGKLCGVGESYRQSHRIPVVLKLHNLYNSSNITSLITGSLESTVGSGQSDPDHFDPISIMLFPDLNYEYTLVSQELVDSDSTNSGTESDVVSPSLPLDSLGNSLCFLIFNRLFRLKYDSNCASSAKKCSPLGDSLTPLPHYVILQHLECFKTPGRLRLLIKFPVANEMWDRKSLDPKATLVGEGAWDAKKNLLFVVACRFLNVTNSWVAKVGDCSTRLSLAFPAVWTIGSTNRVVGRIWSTETAAELGHFEEIGFELSEGLLAGYPHMKYEYTKIDMTKKWCPRKEPAKKSKTYPNPFSRDMTFDVIVEWPKGRTTGRGYMEPISVGNWSFATRSNSTLSISDFPVKLSYRISLFNMSWESRGMLDISAEGIYDVATGSLCMVGCRNVGSNSSGEGDTLDCEILVDFQFPPRDAKGNEGFIKGSIESKRERTDPLHFERFGLSSLAYVSVKAEESIWKAGFEILSALSSNTLACAFAVFQIFHLRRNPGLLPFVSLAMLSTLTFGYSIPTAMAFKSALEASGFETRDALLGVGGWLGVKAVTQGVTGLVLLLLQARLFQLAWWSRMAHENRDELRVVENEALITSLPLYLGGALLSVIFAWSKRNREVSLIASYDENPVWDALKLYADVLSGGFLFPQILLNVFMDSKGKSLSRSFYIGMTLLRVLPHAYGLLYEAQNSSFESASTAWDVISPFGSLLFAGIVYLQQKFGGRCIIPRGSNIVAQTEA